MQEKMLKVKNKGANKKRKFIVFPRYDTFSLKEHKNHH